MAGKTSLSRRFGFRGAPMENDDFIDIDYWADPERNIRRKSGEQETILSATSACSKAEWEMILAGLGMSDPEL